MNIDGILRAVLLGVVLGGAPALAPQAEAESLRVVRGGVGAVLPVSMNRAVVVESGTPFAELSIANPSIADISSLSDRTIYVLGKAPGTTTLSMFDAEGQLIANVDVRVSADISEFKERLKQILPDEPIEVRTANDGIVMSGTVSSVQSLDRALSLAERYAPERVSNLMQVGGVQQVMLKVRFAEMQRSVSKALRSSVNIAGDLLGGEAGQVTTGSYLSTNPSTGAVPLDASTAGASILNFDVGGLEIGILLEALETKGMVRMLAEPNLTALSGQEASFLAGGEYPVPVNSGDEQVTVEFKPFGIQLDFVPRVVDGKIINLELSTTVSAIDSSSGIELNNISIDGFSTRSAATTVELADGESFAIAGLLQDDFRDNSSQLPWIGDVPVLGALFRSAEYTREQSELVIIVTPHLVTPTRGEALALPTDRVRPPTERDLFLFGNTQAPGPRAQRGAAGEVATQDFNGSYGYVMD
ncbi:type II and III secretion system protein family protein [Roseivivax sp.]